MLRPCLLATAVSLFSFGPLQAGVLVRFVEGAPKDRFILQNVGSCDLETATISIDLSTSAGQLIFDVTEAGAGVEVFQPLELAEGADALLERPTVTDGQDFVELKIDALGAGDIIAFTIDVDDTIGQREITVSGSEIDGALVSYVSRGENSTAVFSSEAQANLAVANC